MQLRYKNEAEDHQAASAELLQTQETLAITQRALREAERERDVSIRTFLLEVQDADHGPKHWKLET